jgi:molecular chaperone DnaK (HSP70)
MAQPDSLAVGVDFGTSTSLVAERSGWGRAGVLPLGRTTTWLPSLAAYLGGRLVVGEDAEDADPGLLMRSVKRTITDRRDGLTVAGAHGPRELPAEEVIAAILTEIAERAARLGRRLTEEGDLRLGCPAMWDGGQRRRLIDIAASAGLPLGDSGLIDEPVAAGVAWLANRFIEYAERPAGRLVVFDMGGGTLDIAVLDVVGGPRPEVSVLASLGVAMAGDALDAAIARDLREEMLREGFDLAYHPQPALAWALLEREASKAKIRLSRAAEHPIVLPRQLAYPKVLRYRREQLEDAFRSQMDGAENLVLAALRAALMTQQHSLTPAQIRAKGRDELALAVDHVLLVGGMSRIPYVGRRLGQLFPRAAIHDSAGVSPEEAVVAGLAEKAGYERINIHRPGFDFVLEWDGGRRHRVLYEAYTPLYEPWQVYNGHSDLGYVMRLRYPEVPREGAGVLRVRSITGRPVRLDLNGALVDGLPVAFGSHEFVFKIYCDGGVHLTDGSGRDVTACG